MQSPIDILLFKSPNYVHIIIITHKLLKLPKSPIARNLPIYSSNELLRYTDLSLKKMNSAHICLGQVLSWPYIGQKISIIEVRSGFKI